MTTWQPISTAPKDELVIIGRYNGLNFDYIHASYCMDGDWFLPFDSERDEYGIPMLEADEQPTHWQELPEYPK